MPCEVGISDACTNTATVVLDPKCADHINILPKHACNACLTKVSCRETSSCLTCGKTFSPAIAAFKVVELERAG